MHAFLNHSQACAHAHAKTRITKRWKDLEESVLTPLLFRRTFTPRSALWNHSGEKGSNLYDWASWEEKKKSLLLPEMSEGSYEG